MAPLHTEMTRCCAIGTQVVGDESRGREAISPEKLAHQFQCGMLVPLRLDQHVQDLAFSINSAPEIDHASVDLEIDLIQMPGCVGLRSALAQVCSDQWPKVVHPAPDRLVGDRDAAFGEQILYISKAQGEPKVEPYRLLDDLRRKPVTTVADFRHSLGYRPVSESASRKRRDNAPRTDSESNSSRIGSDTISENISFCII